MNIKEVYLKLPKSVFKWFFSGVGNKTYDPQKDNKDRLEAIAMGIGYSIIGYILVGKKIRYYLTPLGRAVKEYHKGKHGN